LTETALPKHLPLAGQVAVITGAGRGIGRAIALKLAELGAHTVLCGRSREALEQTAAAIQNSGQSSVKSSVIECDVTDLHSVEALAELIERTFHRVDILVNNAGVYEFLPLENVSDDHFHRLFDLNVLGLLLTSKEAAKHFGADGGSIINISSVAGIISPASASVYASTKAAVDSVTRSLAKEFGARKIRVNSINPGLVETEGVHTVGFNEGDFRKAFEAQSPLGRIGQPEDISPAAVFLASGESSWITGETLVIAGGVR